MSVTLMEEKFLKLKIFLIVVLEMSGIKFIIKSNKNEKKKEIYKYFSRILTSTLIVRPWKTHNMIMVFTTNFELCIYGKPFHVGTAQSLWAVYI